MISFTAPRCSEESSSYFHELSQEANYDHMKFFLVDTDQLDKTAEATFQNAVTKIPTFQIWKNGEKTDEIVGYSKDKLKSLVAATFTKQKVCLNNVNL